jgi:hypothetical protein
MGRISVRMIIFNLISVSSKREILQKVPMSLFRQDVIITAPSVSFLIRGDMRFLALKKRLSKSVSKVDNGAKEVTLLDQNVAMAKKHEKHCGIRKWNVVKVCRTSRHRQKKYERS